MDEVVCRKIMTKPKPITNKQPAWGVACGCHMLYWKFINRGGFGVTQDFVKAREYYEPAAEKGGLPVALYNLGQIYNFGCGVEQDYQRPGTTLL
jgi:hypothetical protein